MSRQKLQLTFALLPVVKLALAAFVDNRSSKTRKGESIILDWLECSGNWEQVCLSLKQEAMLRQTSPGELIREALVEGGHKELADLEPEQLELLIASLPKPKTEGGSDFSGDSV